MADTAATSSPVRPKVDTTSTRRGHLIRSVRIRLGLTQSQLAQQVGVSENSVGAWEHGQLPRLSTRKRLAEALGIQLSELVDEEEDVATVHALPHVENARPALPNKMAEDDADTFRQLLLQGLRDGSYRDPNWLETAKTLAAVLDVAWAPNPPKRG